MQLHLQNTQIQNNFTTQFGFKWEWELLSTIKLTALEFQVNTFLKILENQTFYNWLVYFTL